MSKQLIENGVRQSLEDYFKDLHGIEPAGLYEMMLQAMEKPLLEFIMHKANHNQSRAAQWLGLNRNTLRKKLLDHQIAP